MLAYVLFLLIIKLLIALHLTLEWHGGLRVLTPQHSENSKYTF